MSGTVYLYVDGVELTNGACSVDIDDGTQQLRIGLRADDTQDLSGRIQMVRISNVARWTGAFTPPRRLYR